MDKNILEFIGGVVTGYLLTKLIEYEFKAKYLSNLNILEKRIEKLEDFRFSLYEKNLLLGEKREWDEISSEISDHLTDEDIEEEEI